MISIKFKNFYPFKFDWGQITVEGYNETTNEITLIFNCDLRSDHAINNTIQYVIGRVCWGVINFPENCTIKLTFDIRGQEIIMSRSKKFKENLSERFHKLAVIDSITIDFLR